MVWGSRLEVWKPCRTQWILKLSWFVPSFVFDWIRQFGINLSLFWSFTIKAKEDISHAKMKKSILKLQWTFLLQFSNQVYCITSITLNQFLQMWYQYYVNIKFCFNYIEQLWQFLCYVWQKVQGYFQRFGVTFFDAFRLFVHLRVHCSLLYLPTVDKRCPWIYPRSYHSQKEEEEEYIKSKYI